MKSLFAALLITSYVAIGIFGIFGMHTQADMNTKGHENMVPSNCVVSSAKGVDCPKGATLIDFATFHIGAFRDFSLATFGENLLVFLLTLLFLAIVGTNLGALLGSLAPRRYDPEQFSSPSKQQLLRWLSLHENSPAAL